MISKEITRKSLAISISKRHDELLNALHDHALETVGSAARQAFMKLVGELRDRGIELEPFGSQSTGELHYRAQLDSTITSKQLVFAIDVVVTVGPTG
jgi:hypothetical protein